MTEQNNDSQRIREDEFFRLFVAHQKQIYTFILVMVQNTSDADDIFQETMAVMWRKFDQYQPNTSFAAWGTQIAKYHVLSHRRKQGRQAQHQFSDDVFLLLLDSYQAKEEQVDERLNALQRCVGKLNERARLMIHMRYEKEIPVRTIAEHFSVTVQNVYQAMNRINAVLLRCIRRTISAGESS